MSAAVGPNPISYHLDKIGNDDGDRGEEVTVEGFTLKEQRKIIHRVDRRLVTWLGVLYSIALIDRINLPNANIAVCPRSCSYD
jgi:hypothetical protein